MLELSARTARVLDAAGVRGDVETLSRMEPDALLSLPGFGPAMLSEIRSELEREGASFGEAMTGPVRVLGRRAIRFPPQLIQRARDVAPVVERILCAASPLSLSALLGVLIVMGLDAQPPAHATRSETLRARLVLGVARAEASPAFTKIK